MPHAGLRLTFLWLVLIPYLLWGLVRGLWDWLSEIRQVKWRIDEKIRLWRFARREVLDPGCHLREEIAARMPTSYRQEPSP